MLTLDFDRLAMSSGDRVLDLGCGAGRHSFEALRRGARVVAADLDPSVLEDVAGLAAAMLLEGQCAPGASLSTARADALHLPFADGSFEVVIASEVLEHIPDDLAAMSEMHRVLTPDGVLVVTVPRWWPERVCWALSDEYHAKAGGHVRIYRSDDLIGRLTRAGFSPTGRHHAHALHAPYWWLKCAVGPDNEDARTVRAYKRFLEWDIVKAPRPVRVLERLLDPMLGKSLVVYLTKEREATQIAA